jgi:biopolymer transport protein ExbB/TolQ
MQYDLTVIAVLTLAGLIFIQSLVVTLLVLWGSNRLAQLKKATRQVSDKTQSALESLNRGLDDVQSFSEKLPALDRNVEKAMVTLSESTSRLDGIAEKSLEALRDGVKQAHNQSDAALSKFSRGSYRVHQAILNPSHQISETLTALGNSIAGLFSRSGNEPRREHPDEQIFI